MTTASSPIPSQRSINPAALFVLSCVWVAVSLAGGRFVGALSSPTWYEACRQLATAAILCAGFYLLARLGVPDLRPLSSIGFVRREGAATELGLGTALGWGIGLTLMLPAVLSGNIHLAFDLSGSALQRTLINLVVCIAWALVLQLVLSGLPVRLLVRSIGTGWAVTVVVIVAACMAVAGEQGQGRGLLFTAVAASLFLSGFLRTRAIWLPLGLQVGWTISLQVLFGARSPYLTLPVGIVQSNPGGPTWLTGGFFGPEAAAAGVLILLAALVLLFHVTRTYAWHYTYQPIVAAGYPMDIAPPAAHVAEEQRPRTAAPLVQIGGVSPAAPPSHAEIP